jgi:signal transduction histidine kinase/phage shock protein PspC (stress-responsive transcriptional regulator)
MHAQPADDERRHRHGRWPGRHAGWRSLRRGPWRGGAIQRDSDERLVGGVAAGLATWTGFDVTIVRLAFVVAALASGFGAAAYVVAWLLLPATGQDTTIASKAIGDRRGITLAAGLASLLIVVLLIVSALGVGWVGSLAWPSVVTVAGLVLIVRNATPGERATIAQVRDSILGLTTGSARSRIWWRVAIGMGLLIGGLLLLTVGHPHEVSLIRPLIGVALVVAAIVVALGPWWLRIARDLVLERQARARAEERADMASRVHDSVLQTLALIQLHADEPQQVVRLARAQERELRSWLFDGRAPGSLDADALTVDAAVRAIQQEIELQHGVAIEAVTVGDCALDDNLAALLAAAREATVNAVKWSGAPVVTVFTEVESESVSIFIRDRGRGFDPAAVPADRKGVAESIHARMTRRGGLATVRSIVGEGTEVSLRMPRVTTNQSSSRA